MNEPIRIPLRRRDGTVCDYALIDETDAEQAQHRWYRMPVGYVARGVQEAGDRQLLLLHREILGLTRGDGRECDHKNGDRLDNRRANLRVATHAQNGQNVPSQKGSSRFRGVTRHQGRWMARATLDGRDHYLGMFASEEAAAAAASAFRVAHMTHTTER